VQLALQDVKDGFAGLGPISDEADRVTLVRLYLLGLSYAMGIVPKGKDVVGECATNQALSCGCVSSSSPWLFLLLLLWYMEVCASEYVLETPSLKRSPSFLSPISEMMPARTRHDPPHAHTHATYGSTRSPRRPLS